ncbi:hybrid sensor histidine kinase/response regulator transcription factor [Niabella terrae]
MRFLRFSCLLLPAALLFSTTLAGQYYFKHYRVDDGLVHNSVTAVIQDRTGLLWIGTRGGLNRFDGYTFKTFVNAKNRLGSIGNNIINSLAEDQNGLIWIGTGKGLFQYNPYQEKFLQPDSCPQSYTSNLIIDRRNNLWFLINYSLYRYDPVARRIEALKISASCIALDDNDHLWIGENDGTIYRYEPNAGSENKIRIVSTEVPANSRSISKIYPIDDHQLLVGCFKQGLKLYNTKTGTVRDLVLETDHSDIYVRDITRGERDQFWIATESGIYIYDLQYNTRRQLKKRAGDPYAIGDNAVYTVCRDRRGSMWAGTFFGGLNYYSKDNARFEKYYPVPGFNSISGEAVREICADNNGHLWIGTEDAGLNRLDLSTGNFRQYRATGEQGAISYSNIHGLLAVGDQLYIGPFLQGLEIMDMKTGYITDRFKLIGSEGDQVSDFIISIFRTREGKLLIGTAYRGSGLFEFDPILKTFRRIKEIPYNSYVFDIFEDSRGNIWTGSVTQGVYYYNPHTGKTGNFRFGHTDSSRPVNEFAVHSIFEDSDHNLWFATTGGGLIKMSPDWKTTKRFTTEEGLPTNVLYSILEDDAKHLWISSLKGLVRLNLRNEQIRVYTRANGLITDQFNYNSAYKHSNGRLYFGSVKGMIGFDPAAFDQKEPSPPMYITGFQINNKEVLPDAEKSPLRKSILYTDTITLQYNQNNFSVEFAAVNFSAPEVTRYKYRLNGLDKEWTYLTSNRNAYFTDLAPGRYEFIVQAESNIGTWEGQKRTLYIHILPPIWRTRTAYVFYLLAFLGLLYLALRYYHRYQEKRQAGKMQLFELEKEKEIYQSKIEFFTHITHEIQTPLTLISGPIELLRKKFGDDPKISKSLSIAEKNTHRLVSLTTQLLDFRKTEANQFSLNFVKTDIGAIITDIAGGFRQQAESKGIEIGIQLPELPIMAFVDREAFIKIVTNLTSNGVKYAAEKVDLHLDMDQEMRSHFRIRFHNDGKAIPDEFAKQIFDPFVRLRAADQPGTGIGLSLARSLTELHKGTLTLLSGKQDLIIFELKLPIHQEIEFQLGSWKKIN